MTDALKITIKTGLIAIITATIVSIFTIVPFPAFDLGPLIQAFSKGLAIANYWIPGATTIIPVCLVLLTVNLSILLAEIALVSTRWIMKVNE